ncbi:MAG: glycosyltransferase family 2 protein [Nitrospirales bacterium]
MKNQVEVYTSPSPRKARETVGCAVVAFNEALNLQACLESAKWMDEIIVVDSFSTDSTMEIARQYTDRLYQRPWKGFGDQKNYAMDQATTDWVFILDSDEQIPDALRWEIEAVLSNPSSQRPVAYSVPRHNYYFGSLVLNAGCYPDYQLRLFRRGIGHLDDAEPHNKFIFSGEADYLQCPLIHNTRPSLKNFFEKFPNFTTLAAQERSKSKQKVWGTDLLFRPVFTFFKYYVARGGYRDGMSGFLVSALSSMYTFAKYAKLLEMKSQPRSL